MSVNPWLKPNKKQRKPIKVVVSEGFLDEEGNPMPWILKHVPSKTADLIQEECFKDVVDPKTGLATKELDITKYQNGLIAESVIDPPLRDKDLWKSWGVDSAVDLMLEMLDFDEKQTLIQTVTKMYNLGENEIQKKADDAKNE